MQSTQTPKTSIFDLGTLLYEFGKELSKSEYEQYLLPLRIDEKNSKAESLIFKAPNELIARFANSLYAERIARFYEARTNIKAKVQINSQKSSQKAKISQLSTLKIKEQNAILNPSYSFESFVCGQSNEMAFSACKACIKEENFGKSFNPIFICGTTGLGKTHLLHAVGSATLQLGKNVIYKSANQFRDDYTQGIKDNNMEKFRASYAACDLLLIDDVQFFNTQKTQEEFFDIFNAIKERGGQIILSSDKMPEQLPDLTSRLKSRFKQGLITNISTPELETKIAIIKRKCEINDIQLDSDIVNYIATSMGSNIREIEGFVTTLYAQFKFASAFTDGKITLNTAKTIMKDFLHQQQGSVTLDDIFSAVSAELNIKVSVLKSGTKAKKVVEGRRIIIALAKALLGNSMASLALAFGLKDHSAISHNLKKVQALLEDSEDFKSKVEDLKGKINRASVS